MHIHYTYTYTLYITLYITHIHTHRYQALQKCAIVLKKLINVNAVIKKGCNI